MRGDLTNWRQYNIGRLLNQAVHRFESRILVLLEEQGFTGVRLAHINVTRNLDVEGTRATELASRASMTKQAMGELIEQCVGLGLVRREPDPADGRAKIIRFTASGLHFLDQFRLALLTAKEEMDESLGPERVQVLLDVLWDYCHPEAP
ncbi:MarR family winged helix-turn-helix transcriptional regulator [Roseomonas chloroacetimidivorans]|uniref:MarR family winged helix-turn-helix transcriptional regulator n=1 Tax=Roseomonas chloroacetimidivorans TaxID=1766656 RepID=UPI003C77A81B